MAKREKIHFESVDQLLGAPTIKDGTEEIRIDKIHAFKDHPFKVIDDEKMEELVESIRNNGVLSPVLVRPDHDGGYEMISGHRRMHAAKLAGLETLPAIVKEMDVDEATIIMVDSNVQREEILPSERAFSLKMKMKSMRRQGARTDLASSTECDMSTSRTECEKTETSSRTECDRLSADIAGQSFGLRARQVQKYVRLTELIPELLQMVDDKSISVNIGYEVSAFDKDVQRWIFEYRSDNGFLKMEQIEALKSQKNLENLTQYIVIRLMNDALPEPKVNGKVVLPAKRLNKFFPSHMSAKERTDIIIDLLTKWKQEQEGSNDEA